MSLSTFGKKCRYYFPVEKNGSQDLVKCWEQQLEKKRTLRFWITTGIGFLTLISVAITAWTQIFN